MRPSHGIIAPPEIVLCARGNNLQNSALLHRSAHVTGTYTHNHAQAVWASKSRAGAGEAVGRKEVGGGGKQEIARPTG